MTQIKPAFIFDLNGTMIDDMNFHIEIWHKILNDLGCNISVEETKLQCYGKNGEVLERAFPGRFSLEEMKKMEIEKETKYQECYRPNMKLIDGLDNFLVKSYQHKILMGIGSAAIPFNINFIVDGLQLQKYFKAIVSAHDVVESKPHPETFLKCAEQLGVQPKDCIVFEDSPKGVEAASRSGMRCVVLTTMHTKDEFFSDNIICFTPDYKNGLFEKLVN